MTSFAWYNCENIVLVPHKQIMAFNALQSKFYVRLEHIHKWQSLSSLLIFVGPILELVANEPWNDCLFDSKEMILAIYIDGVYHNWLKTKFA